MKFNYNGEDFIAKDYINQRDMPMVAKMKVTGATKVNFDMASMYEAILKTGTIKDKQEFSYILGKA